MTKIKIHIFNVKLPFYPPCEVKYRLQNGVSTIDDVDSFVNHSLAASLRVVGKERHRISSGGC